MDGTSIGVARRQHFSVGREGQDRQVYNFTIVLERDAELGDQLPTSHVPCRHSQVLEQGSQFPSVLRESYPPHSKGGGASRVGQSGKRRVGEEYSPITRAEGYK